MDAETQDTTEPKHMMSVLNIKGDLKVIWDSDKPDEVEAARKQFNEMTKKGYVGFKVGDVLLAQKLWLEANEADFLRVANVS